MPSDAAQLFMAIEGFEPYFNEQHKVLNPAYRELSGVNGIQISNDSTVVFDLAEKDPHFLQKLASPYASIYPREAVQNNPQNFAPVGSGPFRYSQQVGDSLYVFSKNNEYQQPDDTVPVLDRVDVMVETNESLLLKALASGNVHLVPEVGPQILSNILQPKSGMLSPAYNSDYTFVKPGGATTYDLQYNTNSVTSEPAIRSLFYRVDLNNIANRLPGNLINVKASTDSVTTDSLEMPATVLSTYSEDPFQRWFLQQISNEWMAKPQLQILRIRTPSRHTALYTSSFVPTFPGQSTPMHSNVLMRYSIQQSVLAINQIKQLPFNSLPWWIDLRTLDMPGIDNL
ncbi:MAG: ABC transporter substrate-binding protein [Balneolaceae bacterium]|nr:ABC transporter substrate-binding protein [Balneolaceae bacterium]